MSWYTAVSFWILLNVVQTANTTSNIGVLPKNIYIYIYVYTFIDLKTLLGNIINIII